MKEREQKARTHGLLLLLAGLIVIKELGVRFELEKEAVGEDGALDWRLVRLQ